MAVLLESPWYQQILREGEVRARQDAVLENLDAHFGRVPPAVAQKVRNITDLERLRVLLRKSFDASTIEEFSEHLAE